MEVAELSVFASLHFNDGTDRNHSTHKYALSWWNWQKSFYSQVKVCTFMIELTEFALLTSVHSDNGTDRMPRLTSVHFDEGTDKNHSTHKCAFW